MPEPFIVSNLPVAGHSTFWFPLLSSAQMNALIQGLRDLRPHLDLRPEISSILQLPCSIKAALLWTCTFIPSLAEEVPVGEDAESKFSLDTGVPDCNCVDNRGFSQPEAPPGLLSA